MCCSISHPCGPLAGLIWLAVPLLAAAKSCVPGRHGAGNYVCSSCQPLCNGLCFFVAVCPPKKMATLLVQLWGTTKVLMILNPLDMVLTCLTSTWKYELVCLSEATWCWNIMLLVAAFNGVLVRLFTNFVLGYANRICFIHLTASGWSSNVCWWVAYVVKVSWYVCTCSVFFRCSSRMKLVFIRILINTVGAV